MVELLGALALWGGLFYLLNKFCLWAKERTQGEVSRRWQIAAWVVYLIGLPAWVIILYHEEDIMVALVEAGGAPSMFLGLILAWRRLDECPSEKSKLWQWWLEKVSIATAVVGIAASVYHLGFMTRWSQVAELGVTVGFLVGTYRLAQDRLDGYSWFFLMNVSAGVLMFMQGYFWLSVQQAVSLLFVVDAYFCKKRKLLSEATSEARAV